ncbi:MAG: class I SAM-dependent methyltransferase [Campylobacter sp.]|uniref:class I SAM-dependent methyltransferase n=1 Tax=Campylobacter sp. TaxID=205 RepID=UPI003F9FFE99
MKPILDVCCGSKMFYFDKSDQNVLFCDKRKETHILSDGRILEINPDIVADFRNLPFDDESFYLVVFDPPHMPTPGKNSWAQKYYGQLDVNWREDLRQGFSECMRVLKTNGTFVFKWNESKIKLSEVLKSFSQKPIFGQRRGQTHWLVFFKFKDLNLFKDKGLFDDFE